MEVTIEQVRELREKTGAGILDCKKALQETSGDFNKAIEYLRKQGLNIVAKKEGRTTKEGIIAAYIHSNNKIGVLIELNCETDFVAKTDEFKSLAKDLCMHIAAMDPQYVDRTEIPKDVLEKEKEIYKEEARKSKKPEHVIEKIAEGKLEKFYSDVCLVDQAFVKDLNIKIKDLINQNIAKIKENIVVKKFVRYKVGVC